MSFDYDYIVIGSGFGGSVSAMRLTEKGYSVAILEQGRRFRKEDFAKTNWNLRRFVFMPRLGLKGIMRYTLLPHALILSGAGVGGGSLVYANTLYVPPAKFFKQGIWSRLMDWENVLKPHYDTAKRMMGVIESPIEGPGDLALKACVEDLGRGHTYRKAPVAIHFGEAGQEAADPYFGGEGPSRTGCTLCGGCMVGCRVGAKNTLDKNYLYFAEKRGARVIPERKVVDIRPLEGGGYEVESVRTGAWLKKDRRFHRARGIILAGGVLGTVKLLSMCKMKGSLPGLSESLGLRVCTNSESILGVSAYGYEEDYSKGIAISASVFPDEHTHMEVVRYPKGSNLLNLLAVYLTDGGNRITRPLKFFANFFKHPIDFLRIKWPFHWAERTSILLAMQTVENYMRLVPKKMGSWVRLTSRMERGKEIPTYIPIANRIAREMANKTKGIPQSSVNEVFLNAPATAHILGGACMGESKETGVIDAYQRVFGYENFYICDGSVVPGNLGVNPSLTIIALTEHAMSHIPPKGEKRVTWEGELKKELVGST